MPHFTNTPPPDSKGHAFPILRTPPNGVLRAIVTSDDLIGCNTHFWGGHTVPCTLPDCDACLHGVPYRWHAYLTALGLRKGLHFLYECTAAAAEIFVAYRRNIGHLRGCQFEAYRWRSAPNGRVIVRCEKGPATDVHLPPAPDLQAVLTILWQLPQTALDTGPMGPFGRELTPAPPTHTAPTRLFKGPNNDPAA